MRKSSGLPTRFPPGTKYVLESRGSLVHRFVEFPDGRRVTLRARKALTCCAAEASLVPRLEGVAETRAARTKSPRRRVVAEF